AASSNRIVVEGRMYFSRSRLYGHSRFERMEPAAPAGFPNVTVSDLSCSTSDGRARRQSADRGISTVLRPIEILLPRPNRPLPPTLQIYCSPAEFQGKGELRMLRA